MHALRRGTRAHRQRGDERHLGWRTVQAHGAAACTGRAWWAFVTSAKPTKPERDPVRESVVNAPIGAPETEEDRRAVEEARVETVDCGG
jgi:hypothetical protein